ncbi:Spy/CpxP family protein refolding chaperone [Edaphobacter flagellatus]|uniref:Spy/CpxP family protein refolding chaperone n=1 Tax=Edaphobacter flagellatus TaxID=1933044 RepID=UPI0021B38F74|nr:Spy/CpxP family protein refolding chaperone [Edaphobacter flagellatus]
MTRIRLFATLSIAILCGSSALAQQAPSQKFVRGGSQFQDPSSGPRHRPDFAMGPPGMWWKNPDLVQKLSITADQQKRMDDIFQQTRTQLIDLKSNVERQESLLEPMLAANPPDTNKVLAQIDQVASARAELEKAHARMLLSIRGVLSADQWAKLQAERPARRRWAPGEAGGFGPGGPGGPAGFKDHGPGAPVSMNSDAPLSEIFTPSTGGINQTASVF